MLDGLHGLDDAALEGWVRERLRDGTHLLGHGYQGAVYLFEEHEPPLVIKTAHGRGPGAMLRRKMLRQEREVYRRLAGVAGVPRCFGLLDGRHLVLEFIEGVPFRRARIDERAPFFDRLARLIAELHARGVAHGDLKKKDNLLVRANNHPELIDFGVAIVRRPGFAPLNHFLYELAARFDINACAKLRLGRTPDPHRDSELYGYRRTHIERLAGWIKTTYLALRGR